MMLWCACHELFPNLSDSGHSSLRVGAGECTESFSVYGWRMHRVLFCVCCGTHTHSSFRVCQMIHTLISVRVAGCTHFICMCQLMQKIFPCVPKECIHFYPCVPEDAHTHTLSKHLHPGAGVIDEDVQCCILVDRFAGRGASLASM